MISPWICLALALTLQAVTFFWLYKTQQRMYGELIMIAYELGLHDETEEKTNKGGK